MEMPDSNSKLDPFHRLDPSGKTKVSALLLIPASVFYTEA